MEKKQIVIRTEGMANSYGLGEKVLEGVTLFHAGDYNLTHEQLEKRLKLVRGSEAFVEVKA